MSGIEIGWQATDPTFDHSLVPLTSLILLLCIFIRHPKTTKKAPTFCQGMSWRATLHVGAYTALDRGGIRHEYEHEMMNRSPTEQLPPDAGKGLGYASRQHCSFVSLEIINCSVSETQLSHSSTKRAASPYLGDHSPTRT